MFLDILKSSESELVCYIFFMSHMSTQLATFSTSTATRWDVFRNFQNVTNFDRVDIRHQKHVVDFPDLFRNYPLYIFVLWVCFSHAVQKKKSQQQKSDLHQWIFELTKLLHYPLTKLRSVDSNFENSRLWGSPQPFWGETSALYPFSVRTYRFLPLNTKQFHQKGQKSRVESKYVLVKRFIWMKFV